MTVQPAPGISNVLETVPPKTERTELLASVEMSMPLLSIVIPGRLGCGWRPNFPVSTPRRTGQGRADRLRSKAAETIFPSGVSANSPAELSRSALSSASMILRMALFRRFFSASACWTCARNRDSSPFSDSTKARRWLRSLAKRLRSLRTSARTFSNSSRLTSRDNRFSASSTCESCICSTCSLRREE